MRIRLPRVRRPEALAAGLALALASCVADDAGSGGEKPVASAAPAESVVEAVWSADGARLAVTWIAGERVRLRGQFGPAEDTPPTPSTGLPLGEGNAGWASWSPDGLWVAYAAGPVGARDIHRMRPDGTGAEALTSDPADDFDPAYGPNGRTLAFVSTRNGGMPMLHVMDAAGGEARLLADLGGAARRPMWAPDGRRLAVQVDEDGEDVIYVVSADGSGWGRLGGGGLPAWFPDAQRIAFVENDSIFWRPAEGGPRRFVVADGSAPRPSPAGRWLVFVRGSGGSGALYLLDLEDGTEMRITP